ncbi:Stf0 family sulfotransferase [Tabrizicola sp.]|uniref:Stf0 family sulfotransferase n=1 Tax=Tabrizicola sp. TaxID=2005166 RepID=UPI0025E68925|nr:Stf0 family sulfotransferase [Tabrizicola sp.]
MARAKGSLILTEGRSGSNWLISLTNGTGFLGNSGEWFSSWFLRNPMPKNQEELIERVLAKASTSNGYFCVKIFPAHVHFVQIKFGFDLIKYFMDEHDTNLVRLTRRDRIRQAISYARGIQTNQWTKSNPKRAEAEYDFDLICRCYFLLSRSDAYWNAYLELRQLEPDCFVYEDLLGTPEKFVNCISDHCGRAVSSLPESKHSIQRDARTEEWLARFVEDVGQRGIVEPSTPTRHPPGTASNLVRLFRGKALKPYPYTF